MVGLPLACRKRKAEVFELEEACEIARAREIGTFACPPSDASAPFDVTYECHTLVVFRSMSG